MSAQVKAFDRKAFRVDMREFRKLERWKNIIERTPLGYTNWGARMMVEARECAKELETKYSGFEQVKRPAWTKKMMKLPLMGMALSAIVFLTAPILGERINITGTSGSIIGMAGSSLIGFVGLGIKDIYLRISGRKTWERMVWLAHCEHRLAPTKNLDELLQSIRKSVWGLAEKPIAYLGTASAVAVAIVDLTLIRDGEPGVFLAKDISLAILFSATIPTLLTTIVSATLQNSVKFFWPKLNESEME
jgi:hypothetical protein